MFHADVAHDLQRCCCFANLPLAPLPEHWRRRRQPECLRQERTSLPGHPGKRAAVAEQREAPARYRISGDLKANRNIQVGAQATGKTTNYIAHSIARPFIVFATVNPADKAFAEPAFGAWIRVLSPPTRTTPVCARASDRFALRFHITSTDRQLRGKPERTPISTVLPFDGRKGIRLLADVAVEECSPAAQAAAGSISIAGTRQPAKEELHSRHYRQRIELSELVCCPTNYARTPEVRYYRAIFRGLIVVSQIHRIQGAPSFYTRRFGCDLPTIISKWLTKTCRCAPGIVGIDSR